ncbi:DHH family phosphoesterase [Chroococcidiopsis sp. CCNUC1]|uniref:single-stranded-DNA-specific exonuclease RecJ n=1 Tax=Chroococcidiopsis sp. CCNUC1 TaxID=2653189 RepID=UPI0035323EF2
MNVSQPQWIVPTEQPPEWFVQAVREYAPSAGFAAQLLWQRGVQAREELPGYLNPRCYQPASPFEFGQEMHLAVERLQIARDRQEKVAIWGDFDADGITSTAVLWDGLGQFFCQHTQLSYYIPNRLTESHGLNCPGIDLLARDNCKLIVTCDTGSTNVAEILYAKSLGVDAIVTDHHTLPAERPPVTAIINPRYFPSEHQLFHLSGVAVAYKLVEALYQFLPNVPRQPLEDLLDLVAIGLISDLVQLSGDCRYLAQLGIERMQQDYKQPVQQRRRPGVGRLLEMCQKSGDRPTDISFGLGPRINAVSRIQGDASFCVQLLTSDDLNLVERLAQETELANTRRKSLQKEVSQQVAQKLKSEIDLSTTSVIVLVDSQWSPGVLGLVAGQIAQETGRPTILLSTEGEQRDKEDKVDKGDKGDKRAEEAEGAILATSHQPLATLPTPALARGSARSVGNIDLYQLVKDQAHLLHRFGGHPFAAGLSIPVENIPLFTAAINQKLRQQGSAIAVPSVQADLVVTVADLGRDLFLELKLLEPCGMGNPVPKLLIQNCWFENAWHRNQQDWRGNKVQYIKTDFNLRDDSTKTSFPGVWWGHYKDEIPTGRCDCIVELDYNSYKNKQRYEVRLIAVRTSDSLSLTPHSGLRPASLTPLTPQILDCRGMAIAPVDDTFTGDPSSLVVRTCPTCWDELRVWMRRSQFENKSLVLAWTTPEPVSPPQVWQQLVGIAKYLCRTGQTVTRVQLSQKLGISDRLLGLGFTALSYLGFYVSFQDRYFHISQEVPWHVAASTNLYATDAAYMQAIDKFAQAVREEQFQRQYFSTVPLSTIQAHAAQLGVRSEE